MQGAPLQRAPTAPPRETPGRCLQRHALGRNRCYPPEPTCRAGPLISPVVHAPVHSTCPRLSTDRKVRYRSFTPHKRIGFDTLGPQSLRIHNASLLADVARPVHGRGPLNISSIQSRSSLLPNSRSCRPPICALPDARAACPSAESHIRQPQRVQTATLESQQASTVLPNGHPRTDA